MGNFKGMAGVTASRATHQENKMANKTNTSPQHSSVHGDHKASKAHAAPAATKTAPASETKPATPAKAAGGTDKHSGHSPAQKTSR